MSKFRKFNPKELELRDVHQLLLGGVAPRPIGFAASMSKDGNINLAPFSYHNAFSSDPLIVGISPAFSGRTGEAKNTLTNILDTKEFTLSVVSFDMVEQMNICAAEYPSKVDEFVKSGLTKHPSKISITVFTHSTSQLSHYFNLFSFSLSRCGKTICIMNLRPSKTHRHVKSHNA